jgi:hypothetical protein
VVPVVVADDVTEEVAVEPRVVDADVDTEVVAEDDAEVVAEVDAELEAVDDAELVAVEPAVDEGVVSSVEVADEVCVVTGVVDTEVRFPQPEKVLREYASNASFRIPTSYAQLASSKPRMKLLPSQKSSPSGSKPWVEMTRFSTARVPPHVLGSPPRKA